MKAKAPIEIEILLWYYHSPEQHFQATNENMKYIFDKFCENGYLIETKEGYEGVRGALDCYVKKLTDIELPKHI